MQKIKSLMTRQGLKSPPESFSDLGAIESLRVPGKEEFRELREQPSDPQAEQELINSIEQVYFSTDSFDIVKYELEKLPPVLNLQELEEYRDKLKQQQAAVSKKVADLILEKQPAYVKELERVTSLQTGLQLAAVICTNGRRHLNIAKEGFTQASLGLLANQRKRQLLIGLLKSLRTIKTLQRTDVRLSEMLEEEDYPGAIQLCLECQKAASTFKHYSCISELNSKLQDTLEQIEEQLDVALSKICKNFDVNHYTKVQQAYRLLGKTQTAMDQLHMHFTQAIHNTVFQVVLGYVELCAGNTDTKFQKLQYKDLCTHVTPDSYIPCLADLCKALWEVMLSYYRTMEWHEKHDNEDTTSASEGSNMMGAEETSFDRGYIKKKLEHGLTRIWQDVQLKVKTYLLGTDLSIFKYDDFIFVLDIISRLMQVGEEFCGSKSEVLQESIRKQSVNYFKNYHRTRLDELRMFLENETWELCPVKSNFSILQLHEFKFMEQSRSPSVSPSKQSSATSSKTVTLFEQYCSGGNPFEIQADHKDEETEDVLASNGYESDEQEKSAYQEYDSDSDVPEELKRDFVDEQTGDAPVKSVSRETLKSRKKSDYSLNKVNAPILTNTTLNVIRLVGKYMQMMNILKPIAFDVIHFMSQLFDYYLYAIYTFFGRNDSLESTGLGLSSSRLRTTLNRIQESLIDLEVSADSAATLTAAEERKEKVPSPHLSHLVVLTSGDTLYGLAERVVATESLVFLAEQFEFLQPHLDAVMPAVKKPFLQQFYSQTVSTASELRKPIYWIVAGKAIDYEQMLLLMANVKWDVKEIMSQHNIYVDTLLKEFEQFNMRLNEVSKRVRIPLPVSNILWEHCIRLANRTIVEGYANVKKCSNEGRALMQLDFQQFLMKLEKLTDIRPIPDKEFVETYIKAYYLTENDMERWIKEHREYSTKQLTNLVNVCLGSHINKKARQKLLSAIDDIDRPKR
ncbi:syndetin isoform X1 [Bos indicus]|uniref:VPS50 subunit of EARP/GARPII complex n=4 Tax=Bovinae TaxID=27592 RepID=A0A4W2HRE7_BOBOX|nr:PREDICTED: coiled-coil domain-containing protein 132 [Bison bison bison]XP_019815243.1 PREDICTED: syndetin isoform X1 [Bos indicus]XP_027395961.1 syndetin isoform X1 [Bos indicus x Bos taurus]DAA30793.1 TPA: coiled-coil domain containing 132 [Bos taurus]